MHAERPKLSDPARGTRELQPERDGRVSCSAWLGHKVIAHQLSIEIPETSPSSSKLTLMR